MAQFIKHFVQDLQQDIRIRQCGTIVFNKDNESNVISVDLYNGQEEYSGGGSVAGACICPDGSTVPLTGSISGKTASVTLTGDCFAFPGQIGIGIQVVSGTVKTTVLKAIYNVELFETDDMVDPGSRITASVGQLVADIEAATAEIPASDMASLMSGIAPTFSTSTNYAAGAYVYYSGTLYRFTAYHAAGSWTGDSPSDAEQVALANDVDGLTSDFQRHESVVNGNSGLSPLSVPYIIGSTGKWQSPQYSHIALQIVPGDIINITAGAGGTVYALLKDNNVTASASAHFSDTYPSRIPISANESTGDVTIPADTHYLYLASVTVAGNVIPPSIKINGVEQTYNIRAKIDFINTDVSEIKTDITNINSDITEINSDITQINTDIDDVNSDISGVQSDIEKIKFEQSKGVKKYNLDIWGMRGALPGEFERVTIPSLSHIADIDINLYSDGYKFICDADLTKYKNVSANTYHVTNQTELEAALASAQSGDTIYLANGLYSPITVSKSVNIIGEGNDVVFATQLTGGFNETRTAGIYSSVKTITVPTAVYDATMLKESGILLPLTKVGSLTTLINTPGSWNFSSNRIYIHLFGSAIPTATNVLVSDSTVSVITCGSPTENGTIYFENITVFGGTYNLRAVSDSTYSSRRVIAVDCKFICAYDNNNISMYGVDGLFQRCESFFSYRDGFNYHASSSTGILSNGLEIDCIGHDNGARETGLDSPSNNGTTMHDGGKIIRINGLYYNNNGGNVADTSPNGISYNYGCVAFDSLAPHGDANTDQTSADFWVRSTASMYLYGCRAIGNSEYNLRTPTAGTSTIYVNKCEFERTIGHIENI